MDDRQTLTFWLVVWVLSVAVLLASQWKSKHPVPSLPMTYAVSFSLIHFFGGLIYALPWYLPESQYLLDSGSDVGVVARGFRASAIGMTAFVFGCLYVGPHLVSKRVPLPREKLPDRDRDRLALTLIFMGALFFVLIAPVLGAIPSIGAAAISGVSLVVVGLGLRCWQAWTNGTKRELFKWLGLSAAFPAVTVTTMGFIGYGMNAAVAVWMFVFYFYRPRWQVVVALLAMFYMGLSVWVTYARDRDEYRIAIRSDEDQTVIDRLQGRIARLTDTFASFEFMNFKDQQHLEYVDVRLNQNLLVGQSLDRLTRGEIAYANGGTIGMAALSLIPRILWPGKPITGGGGDIVSRYTGRNFSLTSSFGVGQVMEFAINFGTFGIIVGFTLLGSLLRVCDLIAGRHLESGDWWRFTAWFLIGLSLVSPGGNLAEIVGKVAATVVLVFGLHHFYFQKLYVPAGMVTAGSSPALPARKGRTRRTRRPATTPPSQDAPEPLTATPAEGARPGRVPPGRVLPGRVPPGRGRHRTRRPGFGGETS